MGAELTEDFTDEELAILGEIPDVEPEAEPESAESEGEQGEPTKEAETEEAPPETAEEEEEEEHRVPLSRLNKEVGRRKTLEERNQLLLKYGRDKYFELFPEDRPQEEQPRQQTETPGDIRNMVVNGGDYHGMTLNEVMQRDPATGTAMINEYYRGLDEQRRATERAQAENNATAERMINDYVAEQVKALGVSSAEELTDDQRATVDKMVDDAVSLIEQHPSLSMQQAHILLNHDDMLSKARESGAKGAINHLTQGTVKTVSSGGDEPPTGYEAYMGMSSEKLGRVISNMTDAQAAKFLKEAPAALRKKHPNAPWD